MPESIPTPAASYPLTGIKDVAVRQALQRIFDTLSTLQGRTRSVPEFKQGLNAGEQRVRGVDTPVDSLDAVNLQYIHDNLSPEKIRAMLALGGAAPLNIQNLPGIPGEIEQYALAYGLHADRLLVDLATVKAGYTWYETDRAAIYQVQDVAGTLTWMLVLCRPFRTADPLPTDLGTNDAGFTWFDQVLGVTFRWSGGLWNYYLGSYVEAFANMPAAALADRGFLFIASDYGEHVWRKGSTAFELIEGMGGPMYGTGANRATVAATLGANDTGFYHVATNQGYHWWRWSGTAFVLVEGLGGPMRDTISPDNRPTLGANDVGFRYFATDTNATYRWTGAAWVPVVTGLLSGGTNADLSATGGTSQVLKQVAVGANITVGQLASTDLSDVASGTYTPTLTGVANVDAVTAYAAQYVRVGNTVTVSGRIDADPTTAALSTQVGISLPVASNLGASEQCAGTAACPTISGQSAAILGDAANNRAQMEWIAGDLTNQPMYYTFTYRIIV